MNLTLDKQTESIRLLLLTSLAGSLMLVYRVSATGNLFYGFLLWNLFLAWVPFFISLGFSRLGDFRRRPLWAILLFGTWLAFLPNSPYILTDLVHLAPRARIPLWFDLMLILVFAWTGLLLGLLSLTNFHTYIRQYFKAWPTYLLLAGIIVACSYGVYAGRFLRWNSWDLAIRPLDLLHELFSQIRHPFHHPQTFGMTLSFSVFLGLSYFTLRVFSGKKQE